MSKAVVSVTDQSFASEVEQAQGLVLVDFWAAWCGPCLQLAPVVEAIAQENVGQLKVYKLNVDENELSPLKFRIMSIPTLILFKDGQPVERLVGYLPKEQFQQTLQPHLAAVSVAA